MEYQYTKINVLINLQGKQNFLDLLLKKAVFPHSATSTSQYSNILLIGRIVIIHTGKIYTQIYMERRVKALF